jgi:hypothetical protein
MRRPIAFVALAVLSGVVLAATLFRNDIASATGLAQSVTVNNTQAQAVPVREQNLDSTGRIRVTSTDDPGRMAFAFFKNESFNSGDDSHFASFTVPDGKRLVIESVSIQGALDAGQVLVSAAVQAHVNGQLEDYIMAPAFTGTSSSGRDVYAVSQATTLYADGGTDVKLFGARNTFSGSGILNVSVAGHLIDCSAASCG